MLTPDLFSRVIWKDKSDWPPRVLVSMTAGEDVEAGMNAPVPSSVVPVMQARFSMSSVAAIPVLKVRDRVWLGSPAWSRSSGRTRVNVSPADSSFRESGIRRYIVSVSLALVRSSAVFPVPGRLDIMRSAVVSVLSPPILQLLQTSLRPVGRIMVSFSWRRAWRLS